MLIIDRFEGDFAVCENTETDKIEQIKIAQLPQNVKESDVLVMIDGIYKIDTEKTNELRLENIRLLRELGL